MAFEEITSKIEAFLKEAGLGERLGGNYGGASHYQGIPSEPKVYVRPDWSPVDGGHVIVVTPTAVTSYVIRVPWNYNDWYPVKRVEYTTPQQMLDLVQNMISPPRGCW